MIPGKIAMVKELREASNRRLGLYESKVLVDTLDNIPFREVAIRWERMLEEARRGLIECEYIVSRDGTFIRAYDCRIVSVSDHDIEDFSDLSDEARWDHAMTRGRRIK